MKRSWRSHLTPVNKANFVMALVLTLVVGNFDMGTALTCPVQADEIKVTAESEGKSNGEPEATKQNDSLKTPHRNTATTIAVGDVTYTLPFAFPTSEEILKALPDKERPKNARIQCELVEFRLAAPRFYPMPPALSSNAGRGFHACVAKARFKCTVSSDESKLVVNVDRDYLIAE